MGERLGGKVALLSGAARGQGAAHARLLAEEGCSVLLTDILDEPGETHAEAVRRDGLSARYGHLDVTSAADWARAVGLAENTLPTKRPRAQCS